MDLVGRGFAALSRQPPDRLDRNERGGNTTKRNIMNNLRFGNLLSFVALVASLAWGGAWLAGFFVDSGSWLVRLGLLGVGLLPAIAAVALLYARSCQSIQAAERYFESLAQFEKQDGTSDAAGSGSPPLPDKGCKWQGIARRVGEILDEHRRRVEDLEHSRTAQDIRVRRITAEYDRIKAILSGMSDPIIAIDDYDELVLANQRAEDLFSFDSKNTGSQPLDKLLHCQKLVELLRGTSHRTSSGSRTDEFELSGEDGQSNWYRATATKLESPSEESDDRQLPKGAVAVLRDIGDQKVLQRRNAEFVSSVSHEMKTPLAGIKAYVELLVDGDAEDEETREEFLNVINSQADRLRRLVDNMLNLARIEAGVVSVNKQSRPLNELLEEAIGVVGPSAQAKQIELASDLSPMYLGVLADRDMLLQSAINLLSNAIKYTPEGGKVTLRSRLADSEVQFEVEDTGVGLGEDDCRRIFEKFYRVNKDKQMAAGTGLGLPLAKHIVEDVHGGTLNVQSSEGEGSTFTVTLPSSKQLN